MYILNMRTSQLLTFYIFPRGFIFLSQQFIERSWSDRIGLIRYGKEIVRFTFLPYQPSLFCLPCALCHNDALKTKSCPVSIFDNPIQLASHNELLREKNETLWKIVKCEKLRSPHIHYVLGKIYLHPNFLHVISLTLAEKKAIFNKTFYSWG